MKSTTRPILAGLLALAVLAGCSGGQHTRWIFQSLVGQHVHLQVPAALDFPDTVVLDLGQDDTAAGRIGGMFATAMMGESLESKAGKAVKAAAAPLRVSCATALNRQVAEAQLFGRVDSEAGDLRLAWGVSQWGVRLDRGTGRVEPILDLRVSLILPGVGVVWSATRSAADLGQEARERATALSLAVLAGGPKTYQDVLNAMVLDLGGQMIAEMASNPPRRKLRAPG